MAVQRRQNWLSQGRVDVPAMRSVESAVSNDFDQLIQAFVTGTSQGYIIRGFNIIMSGAINGAASGLLLQVDPGAVLHIAASQSGTVMLVPVGTANQQLNAAINTNVTGSFTPSSVNYVSIDYLRYIDDTTAAQTYIWNPTSNSETTINAPQAQILTFVINISTTLPSTTQLPIATVLTDSNNNVLSIQDIRYMQNRLGTGGVTPDPFHNYPWTQGRAENPTTSTSSAIDPFTGGDKNIDSLKSWQDAVMTSIKEIKGTTYWYSVGGAGSLESLLEDLGNTVITGSGNISHGLIPNAIPILTTTGDIFVTSDQLTNLASVVGLLPGQYIFGTGIPALTTIISIVGNTVTMSAQATLSGVGTSVVFYDPSVVTAPGQINWDKEIKMRVIGSELTYTIAANPTSTDVSLTDDQAAYLTLIRDVDVVPNLIFTNGNPTVTSVGAIAWTTLLLNGDFVKLTSTPDSEYYQILTIDSPSQVTLVNNFAGTSTGAGGAPGQYAFGSYASNPAPSTGRDIFIADRDQVPFDGDVYWLFLRNDNGGSPTVYVRMLGVELNNGADKQIGGGGTDQMLQYIGSPSDAESKPAYVNALNPGSLAQTTEITTGNAASMTSGQYFYIYSSADARTYGVWVRKDGIGVQPVIPYADKYIVWDIITGDTAAQTAAKLIIELNQTDARDFLSTIVSGSTLEVLNNSAGVCSSAANVSVGAPFAIAITQVGTGTGNYNIQDGDNLTLAIKEIDHSLGDLIDTVKDPNYDESVTIVAAGEVPPTSLNGPVLAGTSIFLPDNTRMGSVAQYYSVNFAKLQVFLNGQEMLIGTDYTEDGVPGALSNSISMLQDLVVGDVLEFRIVGGGGSGVEGPAGPIGPVGPVGPPGMDAVGGPVAISTKFADYTVMGTDNVLLADSTGGNITFQLPAVASVVGQVFFFKKIDASLNFMRIQAFGLETIDGVSNFTTTTQYLSFILINDGTAWYIF